MRKLREQGVIKIENIIDEKTQKEQFEKFITFIKKEGATKRQLEILEPLELVAETSLIQFEKQHKTTRPTIKKLEKEGFIKISEKPIYRNPLAIFSPDKIEEFPKLSQEQQKAFDEILKRKNDKNPVYLYGVTGSGKTEIYFNLIKKVLEEGKNVLFLAPEIALASQLTNRLARRFGIDDVAIINFDANYAEQRIRQIQTEIDRLEHDIAIVMRNGRASEIVSSLVNKANGSAGQYQILSDEIIAGENRCLRFVKPGSFGVVYEYVVEPGGNVRRDVRGVMIDGQAVIGKEALIKKKHTDCADVDFLRKDMAEMGASMRVTELQTPEDSSDIEGYLALNADIAQTYLRQVLSEDEWVHVDEIVMRAKSGEGYEDIKATIETANAATGETSDDDTATATLHMKTGEDW